MTKNNRIKHLFNSIGKTTIFSVAVNLLWVYLLYEACRLIFLWLNWTTLGEVKAIVQSYLTRMNSDQLTVK